MDADQICANKVDPEDIIQKLGGFGRFQKLQYFFFCFLWIGCGALAVLPDFMLHLPPYRCSIPDWQNDTFKVQNEAHAACLNETIPLETDTSGHVIYSHCHVFDRNKSCSTTSRPEESLKIISNTFPVKECNNWVYDQSLVPNSAATQMNFVCDQLILISVTNMVYMAGLLIGSFLFGILSDRKGRKLTLTLSILIMSASTFPLYFVNNPILLNLCRLLSGIATNGIFMTAFIMSMEMVTCSHRSMVGLHSQNMYAIGEITVAGICYLIRDWHLQGLVMFLLFIPTIGFYFGIYESPRWLVSIGQLEKAEEVFSVMSRMNGTELSRSRLEETRQEFTCSKEPDPRNESLKKLFQSRILLFRCSILAVNWAAITVVFQGLLLNAGNLSGNLYINVLLSGLVELPAYFLLLLTMDKWGRKPLFFASMMLSGFSCIASALTNIWLKDLSWLSITFAMIGKFAISSAFGIIFNFTTEIFPTVVRNAAMGIDSSVGKVGALAAPFVSQAGSLIHSQFGSSLPMILFGVFTLFAGMLSLFLPETQGKRLPETIEDGENLGRAKSPTQQKEGSVNEAMCIDDEKTDAVGE